MIGGEAHPRCFRRPREDEEEPHGPCDPPPKAALPAVSVPRPHKKPPRTSSGRCLTSLMRNIRCGKKLLPSALRAATVSRGRDRARSGSGAHNAPFPSSQAAKSPPGSLQENTCSPSKREARKKSERRYQPNVSPPRRCKCRCITVCPAFSPWLMTTR